MPTIDRIRMCLLALAAALATNAVAAAEPAASEDLKFFETKVRPVLVENCYKCHGPTKQKSGLRLDSRASALAGGELGPAVVPGKPEESLLVQALQHGDDLKMPPSKKLPADQIAALTRWVKIGAPWPGSEGDAPVAAGEGTFKPRQHGMQISDKDRAHWSFRPIVRPQIPQVSNPDWVKNPIDAFILKGLDAKGLTPNAPAAKVALIRRAYYDLTGLPPSPREIDAFLNDPDPDAYERLIDRLLDSPRYGEKWARHWLDLVRFAETNSFERDNPKPNAWRYRDYVIRSLNADKPYDQFVREQLAGDEIAPGHPEAITATGYYRLGIWDDEPADRDLAKFDSLDDIVATTGQVFLGLTIDCARCHDHKIDPIPQKDYYQLVSFFHNINPFRNGGPTDEVPLFASDSARGDYEAAVRDLNEKRDELQERITAIENEFLASSREGASRRDIDQLRYRFYRDSFDRLPNFDLLKPEDSGELPSGRFDLKSRTRDDAIGFVFEGTLIVPEDGEYTFILDSDDGARLSVEGKPVVTYDGIHGLGEPQSETVTLKKGRQPIRLDYFQRGNGYGLSVSWSGPGFLARTLSADETRREAKAPAELASLIRTRGERVLGSERFRHYQQLRRELRRLVENGPEVEKALCVSESGPVAPETFVMLRGNPHVKGEKVEPGFLSVLNLPRPTIPTPPPDARTSGRRTVLADWIVAPENPLTARVAANRVWQYHFGRGIVRSPSNFGTQGDRPTHAELLDWLATELVKGSWRLKPLHRLIMTSNAYRMSSQPSAPALAKDPTNDAFWRFDMRRLTAEEIRDSVLAVSGSLSLTMYGPGVYPEIPAEVLAGQSQPGKGWGKSPPAEANRRSIYVHVKRSLILPMFESFDLGETDRSSPVRFSTTQPTQALAMLNGKFLNDQADALAARLRREAGGEPASQVRLALRLTTGRVPDEAEVQRGVALIASLRDRDGLSEGEALKAFGLVALNLNEFLFLD